MHDNAYIVINVQSSVTTEIGVADGEPRFLTKM